jgi:hypothetical protein
MKLVEVIILAGAHCISPLQHEDGLTSVTKVSCAVIVERDSETNRVAITPPSMAGAPEVRLALAATRKPVKAEVDVMAASPATPATAPATPPATARALRIEPAAAAPERAPPPPAATRLPDPLPPPASADADSARSAGAEIPPASEAQPQDAERADTAVDTSVKSPRRSVRMADAGDSAGAARRTGKGASAQCRGAARPAWYTNKDGRRKYRCVTSGKTKLY